MYTNKTYESKKNIRHLVTDTSKCDILRSKIDELIKHSDYPISLGKVEIRFSQYESSEE